jgi:hypothetical protein
VRIFTYILILLLFFGLKHLHAKTEHSFDISQLFELNTHNNNSKEKSLTSIINTKNLPSSNKILSEKKIRQRGLVSVCFLFTNKSPLFVNLYRKNLIPSVQTFYILRLFFGNEKRGPPSVLVF